MRITKISVKGLFGMFDHEIPLNQESRITIVHGPNGVGKTAIMEMIYGIFHYEYETVGTSWFQEMRITFDSGEEITVERPIESTQTHFPSANIEIPVLAIQFEDGTGSKYISFMPKAYIEDELLIAAEHLGYEPVVSTYSPEKYLWYQMAPEEERLVTKADLLDWHPNVHTEVYGKMPDWFDKIRKTVRISQVQAQRLLTDGIRLEDLMHIDQIMATEGIYYTGGDKAVSELSFKILTKFENVLERYQHGFSYISQESAGIQSEINEIKSLIHTLGTDLKATGSRDAKSIKRRLESVQSRLNQFQSFGSEFYDRLQSEDLYESKSLFEDIVNERFLFKTVKIDENAGLIITSETGGFVPLAGLSSGEQHLFILYYQLLFDVEPDTLVMIDEPELSMNVVWQRNFLKDLEEIIKLRNFDVLIATHSPMIIHDKWDWVVHLGEKVDD